MVSQERIQEVMGSQEMLNQLAKIEHERWAHWQRYLHDQCTKLDDGSLVIPAELVGRWEEQIAAAYDDLSPDEQHSDQEQVRKYLPVIVSKLMESS